MVLIVRLSVNGVVFRVLYVSMVWVNVSMSVIVVICDGIFSVNVVSRIVIFGISEVWVNICLCLFIVSIIIVILVVLELVLVVVGMVISGKCGCRMLVFDIFVSVLSGFVISNVMVFVVFSIELSLNVIILS